MKKDKPMSGPEALLAAGTKVEVGQKVAQIRPAQFKIDVSWADKVEAPQAGDYLLKGVIEPRQTSIWFGPPGGGKTFLMLRIAYAIAQGHEIFGRRVRKAKTLYMALEGRGGITKRTYALFKEYGGAPGFGWSTAGIEMLTADRSGPRMNGEHLSALREVILANDIKFLIIDTLNLSLGGAEENDNSVMGMLAKAAGEIAEATNAHVAFIAHAGKSGNETGPRGGSAQKGNFDLIVAIEGEDVLTASCAPPSGKIKDGAPFNLHFALRGVELGRDSDDDAITSCVVEEADEPEDDKGPKLTNKQQGWLDDLRDLFNADGEKGPKRREVLSGLNVLTLTRDQVRDGFKLKGRLGDVSPEGTIESRYRVQMHGALTALKDAGKIGMTDKFVWLI